jgi:Vps23 core domain/UEV domain
MNAATPALAPVCILAGLARLSGSVALWCNRVFDDWQVCRSVDVMSDASLKIELRLLVRDAGHPPHLHADIVSQLADAIHTYPLVPFLAHYPFDRTQTFGSTSFSSHRPRSILPDHRVCLHGVLDISSNYGVFNVPLSVYAPLDFPSAPPAIFVRPNTSAAIHPNHSLVCATSGAVDLEALLDRPWCRWQDRLTPVLLRLAELFAGFPPLVHDHEGSERQKRTEILSARFAHVLAHGAAAVQEEYAALIASRECLLTSTSSLATPGLIELFQLRQARRNVDAVFNEYGACEGDISIDDVSTSCSALTSLDAKDVALDDLLDALSSACEAGTLGIERFVKLTRSVAQDQFRVRARQQEFSTSPAIAADSAASGNDISYVS